MTLIRLITKPKNEIYLIICESVVWCLSGIESNWRPENNCLCKDVISHVLKFETK